MNLQTRINGSEAIVYDAGRLDEPRAELFDPRHWQGKGAVVSSAPGRGNTLRIATPFGEMVLREYLRGGWAAHVTRDRYVFTGFSRSRPWREFHVLARLRQLGLSVPEPVAALCRRHGFSYCGWLMTRYIPQSRTLAEILPDMPPADGRWALVGAGIRRFHASGLNHADLNARNVLVTDEGNVFLVDFDRARLEPRSIGRLRHNLDRLRRSLNKLWSADVHWSLDECWGALMSGYEQA